MQCMMSSGRVLIRFSSRYLANTLLTPVTTTTTLSQVATAVRYMIEISFEERSLYYPGLKYC